MEHHHFQWEKIHYFYGKITIFNGKITIFNGKIHYFDWVIYTIANCGNVYQGISIASQVGHATKIPWAHSEMNIFLTIE